MMLCCFKKRLNLLLNQGNFYNITCDNQSSYYACDSYISCFFHLTLVINLCVYVYRNGIISILEDRSCHYKMKVELTILCSIPDFLPPKDEVRTVIMRYRVE